METALLEKIQNMKESFSFIFPEWALGIGLIIILIWGLLKKNRETFIAGYFTVFILSASLIFNFIHFDQPRILLFNGMLMESPLTAFLKGLVDVGGMLTLWLVYKEEDRRFNFDFFFLLLSILMGCHLLIMSSNMLMVVLAVEMISLPSYILVAFGLEKKGIEGSFKYFIFGSVSTAFMLFGFSFLYGFTGRLDFCSSDFLVAVHSINHPLLAFSGLLILSGFFFKMVAIPFHPWAPDVYEAAPVSVTAFFSVVPKIAGFGILLRFMPVLDQIHFFEGRLWVEFFAGMSFLGILIGNFSALWQNSPKRMMAYSTIAHTGFLLIGIVSLQSSGFQALLFYLVVYLFSNFLVFYGIQYFEKKKILLLSEFQGTGFSDFFPHFLLLMGFIALTGLPPTAGFSAKLFIFSSLFEFYQQNAHSWGLGFLIFGLLNTVVSLFYYLKIPYFAFIKNEGVKDKNSFSKPSYLGILLVFVLLLLFFVPDLLMGWINKINFVVY